LLDATKARAVRKTKTDDKRDIKKEGEGSKDNKDKAYVESKFENYFNFSVPVKSVKSYQVSAVYCML
jgi:hypothetical protein